MENLEDKMLKAINETTFEVDKRLAEACARVAEEEIAKAFDYVSNTFKSRADSFEKILPILEGSSWAKTTAMQQIRNLNDEEKNILQLKDKYLKSLK